MEELKTKNENKDKHINLQTTLNLTNSLMEKCKTIVLNPSWGMAAKAQKGWADEPQVKRTSKIGLA